VDRKLPLLQPSATLTQNSALISFSVSFAALCGVSPVAGIIRQSDAPPAQPRRRSRGQQRAAHYFQDPLNRSRRRTPLIARWRRDRQLGAQTLDVIASGEQRLRGRFVADRIARQEGGRQGFYDGTDHDLEVGRRFGPGQHQARLLADEEARAPARTSHRTTATTRARRPGRNYPLECPLVLGWPGVHMLQWRGRVVRLAFALDCHDREVIGWVATTAGVTGEMIRDMMIDCVEKRFGTIRASHPIQWLSDNGSIFAVRDLEHVVVDTTVQPKAIRTRPTHGSATARWRSWSISLNATRAICGRAIAGWPSARRSWSGATPIPTSSIGRGENSSSCAPVSAG